MTRNDDQPLGGKQGDDENPFERLMIFAVTMVLTLVSFPFVVLLVALVLAKILFVVGRSETAWAFAFAIISSAIVGLAACAFIARKSDGVFRSLLAFMRSRLPEPAVSCIAFGVVGALLLGAIVPAVFLLLGHTRPIGWDFDRIPHLMGFGFVVFLLFGSQSGLIRKRGQRR